MVFFKSIKVGMHAVAASLYTAAVLALAMSLAVPAQCDAAQMRKCVARFRRKCQ